MRAVGQPLEPADVPEPKIGPGEIGIDIAACGVCRTDLHIIDGDLDRPELPLILGHQIVGRVSEVGTEVEGLELGGRIGIPWLGWTCGRCSQCLAGRENLCEHARFTGYHRDGGFAERAVAAADYAFPLPGGLDDVHAAPLLCAGLIGYRAWRMCDAPERVGLFGFGSAAHLISRVAISDGAEVAAFTRPGDEERQAFARRIGAGWAGGSDEQPPVALDAAIIFAPVGDLVPAALKAVRPGGRVICAGIHMSEIPAFPYELLWGERQLRSVANLTRRDGEELLPLAAELGIEPEVSIYPLERTNEALEDLRAGRIEGSAVVSLGING